MIRIQITEEAQGDLNDGYWFYEERESGIGDYFAACLKSDIESLRITAGVHPIVYRDYHRLLSRVFPYAIFYTFSESVAVIWAVVDCRRDPAWIRDHLADLEPNT